MKKETAAVVLSKRLMASAELVDRGSIVADVGCDHGYTSIYLVQNGICPHIYAMDVNAGPLKRAGEHVKEYGLSAYISLRQSDGLRELPTGTNGRPVADTLLAAGMGGRLMVRILRESADKVAAMHTLILQPQSDQKAVRLYLRQTGYLIIKENMLIEDGKYYTVIKAVNTTQTEESAVTADTEPETLMNDSRQPVQPDWWEKVCDRYGRQLICTRHPVLADYLQKRLQWNRMIIDRLKESGAADRSWRRITELAKEAEDISGVLQLMRRHDA